MVRSHPDEAPYKARLGRLMPETSGWTRANYSQGYIILLQDADSSEYMHGVDVRRIIKQRSGKDLISTALCIIAENCRRVCLEE
jgi:hypothetical protein